MGKKIREMKGELLEDQEFRREYDALEEEFSIAAQLIEARAKANLTQKQVARRMGTTQSVVARIDPGIRCQACGHSGGMRRRWGARWRSGW